MTAKKKTPAASQPPAAPSRLPSPYHRLETLLRTMRCITQHEDALCELSHEVQRSGLLTAEASDELRGLLDTIPSHDFMDDLDSVSALLTTSVAPKQAASKSTRKSGPGKRETEKRKSSK